MRFMGNLRRQRQRPARGYMTLGHEWVGAAFRPLSTTCHAIVAPKTAKFRAYSEPGSGLPKRWLASVPCAICGPEVRPALPGGALRPGPGPGGNLGGVAGNEDVRDRLALKYGRPGVLRVFQEALGKTLLNRRGLLAHHPGEESHAGVKQRQRRNLAPRKHKIADRDLLEAARLDQPLVHALEPRAEDHHPEPAREFEGPPPRQRPPAPAPQQAGAGVARDRVGRGGEDG